MFLVNSIWGNLAYDYACSLSKGLSGGILCFWDKNKFVQKRVRYDDNFIMIEGNWVPENS